MKKAIGAVLIFFLATVLIVGCSSKDKSKETGNDKSGEQQESQQPKEDVRLHIYTMSTGIDDAQFDELFVQPVQELMPHVSFDLTIRNGDVNTIDSIITSGNLPDIVFTSNPYVPFFADLELATDLSDLTKQMDIDLDRFVPAVMEAIHQSADNGELYAIPLSMNYGGLFYNKDIFDKFGVDYPVDLMTWKEVIELGRSLTREDEGIEYIGLHPGFPENLTRQLSLPYVDQNTGKAMLTDEGYVRTFTMLKQIYDINGIDWKSSSGVNNMFFSDFTLAMMPNWLSGMVSKFEELHKNGVEFHWDVATHPVFEDQPNLGKNVDAHILMISPQSEHQTTAMEVIRILVSDEAQIEMNKNGRLTALVDQNIQSLFASNLDSFQDKNVQSMFEVQPAPLGYITDYDNEIRTQIVRQAARNLIDTEKDINTILMEANEQANLYIQSVK